MDAHTCAVCWEPTSARTELRPYGCAAGVRHVVCRSCYDRMGRDGSVCPMCRAPADRGAHELARAPERRRRWRQSGDEVVVVIADRARVVEMTHALHGDRTLRALVDALVSRPTRRLSELRRLVRR